MVNRRPFWREAQTNLIGPVQSNRSRTGKMDDKEQENLPVELWKKIISFTPKEVKTIRAINKELNVDVLDILKSDKTRVFEFKRVTKSVLEFIEKNVTRVRIVDDGYLEEDDFTYFRNLTHLTLISADGGDSIGCTDKAMRNLVNLEYFEIVGSWPEFEGTTLHELPNLRHLKLDFERRFQRLKCKWSELKLQTLVCNESDVGFANICKLGNTLNGLRVVATLQPTDQEIEMFVKCRRIIDLYIAGECGLWMKAIGKFVDANGGILREFGCGMHQPRLDGPRTSVHKQYGVVFTRFLSQIIPRMPNLKDLSCEIIPEVDIDLSKCKRLDFIRLEGVASYNTVQSIPSGCDVIAIGVDVLTPSTILKIGDARVIEIFCKSSVYDEWKSDWKKAEEKKKFVMKCQRLTLNGHAGGYGKELISKSSGLEYLTVNGLYESYLQDDDPVLWNWGEELISVPNLKSLDVRGVSFDAAVLIRVKKLEILRHECSRKMLAKHQRTTEEKIEFPCLSYLLTSKQLTTLDLRYTAESEIEFEEGKSVQHENFEDILDLDDDEISDCVRKLHRLVLVDLALVYLVILPRCVHLTNLELYSDVGPDKWLYDSMFDDLSVLQSVTIKNVSGLTGDFLAKTPRLEKLVIVDCPTFSIKKLKSYSDMLPYLVDITIESTDGEKFLMEYDYDDEKVKMAIDESYPGANIVVNIRERK